MKTKNAVQYYYNIAPYLHYSIYRPGGLANKPLRVVARNNTPIGNSTTLKGATEIVRDDAIGQLKNIIRDKRVEATRLEMLRFSMVVETKPKSLLRRT